MRPFCQISDHLLLRIVTYVFTERVAAQSLRVSAAASFSNVTTGAVSTSM